MTEELMLRISLLEDGNAWPSTIQLINDLADTIEAQAAEIKRLREALKPFAKSGDLLVMAEDKGDFWAYRPAGGDEYGITGRHLLAARAALGEPTGE